MRSWSEHSETGFVAKAEAAATSEAAHQTPPRKAPSRNGSHPHVMGMCQNVYFLIHKQKGVDFIVNKIYSLTLFNTLFLRLKQSANYPLLAPRPPRFDSVARFRVVRRSSLSFKKRAIFCSKFSFGGLRSLRSFARFSRRGR